MMRLLLISWLLIMPLWASANTVDTLEQAKQDMHAGRYATAIESLRELVDKEQSNYEAWFLFGVAHVHEQQYHQAIEAFRQVIALRPKLAEPHNNLAAVYNNLGDTKAAVKELEIALEKRPNYVVAEENLADLYIKLALQHYRNSLNQSSNKVIEQRYARLLQVRNPTATPNDTPVATAKTTPQATVIKPATQSTKPVVAPATPIAKPQQANVEAPQENIAEAPTSIAEDKSITGVLDALEAWRRAWSAQDLDAYFSAYADDYQPAKFTSINAWKAYKTRVIKNKRFIDVQFDKVEVDIPASRDVATISVEQHFRSNSYNGDDNKKITMKYTPDGWKIIAEVATP